MDASSAPGPKWPEPEGHDTEIKRVQTDARQQNRADKELSRAVNQERFDPNVQ